MPHRLTEAPCTDDIIYYHPSVSATYLLDGKRIFVVKDYDTYLSLKRRVVITYRIGCLEPFCKGMFRCRLDASDGTNMVLFFTTEDVIHNMQTVEREMEIENHLAVVC